MCTGDSGRTVEAVEVEEGIEAINDDEKNKLKKEELHPKEVFKPNGTKWQALGKEKWEEKQKFCPDGRILQSTQLGRGKDTVSPFKRAYACLSHFRMHHQALESSFHIIIAQRWLWSPAQGGSVG